MLDWLHTAWEAFWAIPHIRLYLTVGWIAYLVGLGIYIVLQKREPAATLSWLISLATLPYLGFLIYYLFGPQKITRHRARRRRQRAGLEQVDASSVEAQELRTLGQASTGLLPTTARDVRLLVDGGGKYPALLEDIAVATDHVHLEYYIYNPDHSGTALRDALVERARAGVKVRLLLDAMGAKKAPQRFFAPLVDAGGELAWFHPARPWMLWRRPWVNLRLHRKIVVVDGRVGYLGGINITDEQDERLREDAYRDLHLRVEGDLVRSLQEVFLEDWAYATKRSDFVGEVVRAMPPPQPGGIHAQLLASGPDSPWEAIHRVHVGAIHAATQRAWLVTPYFVPGEAAMMALTSAALGGLDVRLLVPKMSDSKLVTWCVRRSTTNCWPPGSRSTNTARACCTPRRCWWTTTSPWSAAPTSTTAASGSTSSPPRCSTTPACRRCWNSTSCASSPPRRGSATTATARCCARACRRRWRG